MRIIHDTINPQSACYNRQGNAHYPGLLICASFLEEELWTWD